VSDGYESVSKSRIRQRRSEGLMNEMFLDDLRDNVQRGCRPLKSMRTAYTASGSVT
jgi:hypothetical protein